MKTIEVVKEYEHFGTDTYVLLSTVVEGNTMTAEYDADLISDGFGELPEIWCPIQEIPGKNVLDHLFALLKLLAEEGPPMVRIQYLYLHPEYIEQALQILCSKDCSDRPVIILDDRTKAVINEKCRGINVEIISRNRT